MSNAVKVITRIRGGLGNQLFCYAAARRLAVINDAELVIDDVTGFIRDQEYRRKYHLDVFNIPARKASPSERMEPFERIIDAESPSSCRRGRPSREKATSSKRGNDFDERLLHLRLRHAVYLDGLWQGEGYFKDIEGTIRRDLVFKVPTDSENRGMAERMQTPDAVSVHVRWFDTVSCRATNNVGGQYYGNAIKRMESISPAAHYFVFSDRPESVGGMLGLPEDRFTVVFHNKGDANAYADMWLMAKCSKHIIANSTFSWWGAWLSQSPDKIVICPAPIACERTGASRAWCRANGSRSRAAPSRKQYHSGAIIRGTCRTILHLPRCSARSTRQLAQENGMGGVEG